MQMGVTDYTAEDKSGVSSCTDLRLGKPYGNLLNGGDEFRGAAKQPVTRSHCTGEGAKGLGVRGTCCNKLYP